MSRPVVLVSITVLFCLLVSVLPQSEQTRALAEYSDVKLESKNNTNSSTIQDFDEDRNALGFAQGIIRCWVCASCPEVRNGQKNVNATSPRWCPSSVDLNASHMCVTYSIQKSFWSFGWLVDLFGGRRVRRKRKWNRGGVGNQRQIQLQRPKYSGSGRQVGEAANTQSTWIKRMYIYRGCTVYEGFCHEIYQRQIKLGWVHHCTECKGDMCNDVRIRKAFPGLVAMALVILYINIFQDSSE